MRAHRHLHQRLARIEHQQSRLPDDPESLRQAMIRIMQKTLPLDEATAFVNDLLAMPRPEARAWLQARIDTPET